MVAITMSTFFQSLSQQQQSLFQQAEIISFDIFDTAVTRTVSEPKHIFSLVADCAKTLLNEQQYNNFSAARIQAEEVARQQIRQVYRQETSLDEIYRQLKILLNLSDDVAGKLLQIEIETEINNTLAVEPILQIYKKALVQNKKVIFVSDMYLDKTVLEKILWQCGYQDYVALFVSSDIKFTKECGHLWHYIIKEHAFDPTTIVHFGDNAWSDIQQARAFNINAIHFPYLSKQHKSRNLFSSQIIPLSKFIQRNRLSNPFCNDIYVRVGRDYLSILYLCYVKWVMDSAEDAGITHLLFLARDGYILKKVWDILAANNKVPQGMRASYLLVSRRTLIISAMQELDTPTIDFLIGGGEKGRSVKVFIERTGLVITDEIREKIHTLFPSSDYVIASGDDYHRLRQLFGKLRNEILTLSAQSRANVIAYFKQAAIFDEKQRTAIVDLGWHGNMQKAMKQIINFVNKDITLSGFYFGLFRNAMGKIHSAGFMKGMLCNGLQHPEYEKKVVQIAPLLEALHTAPHGSVKAYQAIDGRVVAVKQENAAEQQVYTTTIAPLHAHALATIENIIQGKLPFPFASLDRALCEEIVEELLILPNEDELKLFGRIRHIDGYEHTGRGVDLIPLDEKLPNNEHEAHAIIDNYRFWTPGTLLYWRYNLPRDYHGMLHNLAQQYGFMGENWLSKFAC